MPIIESVSVAAVAVPLDKVTSFSTRTVSERHYCLVKVRGKDGNEGIGFCYVGSAGGDIAKIAVEQLLAPKLIGQNSHRSEGLWMDMYNESILQGRAGAVMRGISILDTALWDLNARAAKLPLHHYLGSVVDDRVPAYASGGYYLDGKTPAMLGKEMESYVKQGFKAVKMKVGRLSPREEEARVKAARKAVGEDVLLTLDANNAWRDLPTALEYIRRFEAYNPYWIEEPFSPDAIDLHAPLVAATPNARFVEFFLDDQVLNFRRLINKQLTFKNGDLILHQTPGLGFEFDEAAVKKYAGKAAWTKIV